MHSRVLLGLALLSLGSAIACTDKEFLVAPKPITPARFLIVPPGISGADFPIGSSANPANSMGLPTYADLHMCVDYDELEIARWLLDRGMDVDARASVDADGFSGHTALFATVVSQPNFWMNHQGKRQLV